MALPTNSEILTFQYGGCFGVTVIAKANSSIVPTQFGYYGDNGVFVTEWATTITYDTTQFFMVF